MSPTGMLGGVDVTGEHAYGLAFALAVGAYVMCYATGISVLRLRLRTGDQFRENHFLPFIYNNVLQNLLLTPIKNDKDFEKSLTNLDYFLFCVKVQKSFLCGKC
jgi:hypothetical protein